MRKAMANKDISIYALIDPTTKQIRYVGATSAKPSTRLAWHILKARSGSKLHTHRWIRKIGLKPEVITLEVVANEHWQASERHWIKIFREQGIKLTNKTDGGEGMCGFETPKSVRESRSKRMMGNTLSANPSKAARKRMSASLKRWYKDHPGPRLGVKISRETLDKMSRAAIARYADGIHPMKGIKVSKKE